MKSRTSQDRRITALYERLSRDDDNSGESNSIINQKKMLENYAGDHGFVNIRHYTDDGWSGTNFDRPGWKKLLDDVEQGEVGVVLVKDMSRIGRNYLQVGFYTEVLFRERGVRFIAIANGVDSRQQETGEFAPFLNIMNEWYVRDTSRKIKNVLRTKGLEGKHLTTNAIYGYCKDPDDPSKWVIDEEAADVVRRIFRMALEGTGPSQIARRLTEEQVERPSYYLAKRGLGSCRGKCDMDRPFTWTSTSVIEMLRRPEYMGHTVNFRSTKESYKDAHSKRNDPDDWIIFRDTQEAIVDEHTWNTVQKIRETKRRPCRKKAPNPLTGLMYCADCGAKMYNHRTESREKLDADGRPTGKFTRAQDNYHCSTYSLHKGLFEDRCTQHHVRTVVVWGLLWERIRCLIDYICNDKENFIGRVQDDSNLQKSGAEKELRAQMQKADRRMKELDKLIQALYEDKVAGIISEKRFLKLMEAYENEQEEKEAFIETSAAELSSSRKEEDRTAQMIALANKYKDARELTPAMVHDFIEKIVVHEADKSTGKRLQQIDVYFHYIGQFEV